MHLLGTLLLMLAGTVIGFYIILPPTPDTGTTLAEITPASVAPDRFAKTIAVARIAPTEPEGDASATRQKPATPWTTVVATAPSAQTPLKSSKPGDAKTRYKLTRDLQRELKRAGCYGGEITGTWSPSTKRAMSAFMDRVNSTLPLDEPDYILLTLVQGNAGTSCSADCKQSEARDANGRCVPRAIVTQAARKSERAEARRVAQARIAAHRDQLANATPAPSGPPSGPNAKPSDMKRATPPPTVSEATSRTANSAREILPWQQATAERPASVTLRPSQPLPGMMSVGGPTNGARPLAPTAPELPWQTMSVDPPSETAALAETLPSSEAGLPKRKANTAKRKPSYGARPKRYAANDYGGRKVRRGEARRGTMRYNLLQSLGGLY